ncbi:hypothetical protein [Bradyrhizobium commune]|uniref:DUF680 domain-containing protein n=1 Tax=Bradyrhizobium commune TaxID=83627 RepID=A0A7S9D7C4_9BRAD|nr:hypothetical protein [Bradyrhizobium commune]QPF92343.1 hypothetical protein IC761_03320 [Bradyrhizobium commune]
MKHGLLVGLALAAFCGASTIAEARPPTVMNSPGYDRRLQESRSALGNPTTETAPATIPKRSKKKHTN